MSRNNQPSLKPILLRYREAATVLSVSESQVEIWVRFGLLTPIPIPGIRAKRVSREQCEALAESWRAAAGGDVPIERSLEKQTA